MANILTEVITSIANERIQQTNRFGMSIVNLPEIDIQYFVENIIIRSRVELFFLGYGKEKNKEIEDTIKFKDGINMFLLWRRQRIHVMQVRTMFLGFIL